MLVVLLDELLKGDLLRVVFLLLIVIVSKDVVHIILVVLIIVLFFLLAVVIIFRLGLLSSGCGNWLRLLLLLNWSCSRSGLCCLDRLSGFGRLCGLGRLRSGLREDLLVLIILVFLLLVILEVLIILIVLILKQGSGVLLRVGLGLLEALVELLGAWASDLLLFLVVFLLVEEHALLVLSRSLWLEEPTQMELSVGCARH